MPNLTLYYMETCPYCQKVLGFMHDNEITLDLKNVLDNPRFRDELLEAGGKTQVPALDIDGTIMYESDDIINWLKDNPTP